jgi:glycerophosphoryl diester phosphodiesterase
MTRTMTAALLGAAAFLAACSDINRTSLVRGPRADSAKLRATAEDLAGHAVEVYGHKIAACDVYPHDPVNRIPSQPIPAADLLVVPDLGPLDGVELDVHAAPDGSVYVSHNPADPDKLRQVLVEEGIDPDRFIQRDAMAESISSYFGKHTGGHLFIELKSSKSNQAGVTDEDRRLAAAVLRQLDQLKQSLALEPLKRITFVSFRTGALQALHDVAAATHPEVGYALILGTDKSFFLLFSDLPDTSDQLAWLSKPESRFIGSVWFSLDTLGSPEQVLQQARAAGVQRLVSDAYLETPDDLKKGLARLAGKGITIEALIFDAVANPANTGGTRCPP